MFVKTRRIIVKIFEITGKTSEIGKKIGGMQSMTGDVVTN
jgi:hypothetical protein